MNNVEVEPLRRKPRAIDLFCGCGGLTLGLKQAGFKVIAGVDNNPLAVRTYRRNHRHVRVWACDIGRLPVSKVKKALGLRKGDLELLAGCPPCQGFSTMRTLNGSLRVKDARNELLFEFQRFVKHLRPRAVMLENVPGLADDVRFRRFVKQLEGMGYIGSYRVLDAADYGVPQRRRRLIYLAGYKMAIPFAARVGTVKTVRNAIGGLPKAGKSGDAIHDMSERRSKKVKEMMRRIPKNGGSRTDLPKRDQLECHKRCDGFKDVYGRMAWDKVAPTITSGCFNPSKGRFVHPRENRAITMREAALLQGFPRRYDFPATHGKLALALMIGNALPPPFIRHHAKQISRLLRKKRVIRGSVQCQVSTACCSTGLPKSKLKR